MSLFMLKWHSVVLRGIGWYPERTKNGTNFSVLSLDSVLIIRDTDTQKNAGSPQQVYSCSERSGALCGNLIYTVDLRSDEMTKRNNLVAITCVLLALAVSVGHAADEDLIPPEVLKQMDAVIRSGKRPTFATVRQGEIFGLRSQPELDADFVRLSFDPSKLSTVQRRIIEEWIRSGVNRIYLLDNDLILYGSLFSPAVGSRTSVTGDKSRTIPANLLRHKVNTDCVQVRFSAKIARDNDNRGPWVAPCLKNLPVDSAVIVEAKGGEVLCGSFKLDAADVVFKLSTTGNDSRRWELNFWHWALGLPVPGVAETGITGATTLTLAQAAKYDTVVLRNGDTVTGEVQNDTFAIKTSYASLEFHRDKLAKVDMEGAGANLDIVTLRVGDKISGVLETSVIRLKLVAGQETELDKDKIKTIRFRRAEK